MKAAGRDDFNCPRSQATLIAAVLFISYAYFYQAGGWNQNTRFDLTRALVEQHSLRIDPYQENTLDKAHFQGHYYSDKAPGLSLLAVPFAAATKSLLQVMGIRSNSPRGVVAMSYAATMFGVSLPAAMGWACLFLIGLRLGGSPSAAAFAAMSLGLATPLWAYATIFWGHALTAACLVFACLAALGLQKQRGPHRDFWLGLAVGLAAGWATVSEYPAAPASAILAGLAIFVVWRDGRSRILRVAGGVGLGALACMLVLGAYQYAAFGSPFHLGYNYDEAYPGMKQSFGLGVPRVDRILKLLFGGRRGIFFHAPIIAAAPFGLRWMWKNAGNRPIVLAASAIAVYYLLFNASFYAWHGGWSYGPRYLAPGLPLVCLGLAPLWHRGSPRLRKLLAALAILSLIFTLAAVATTVQPLEGIPYPLFQVCLPKLVAGKLSLNQGSFLAPTEAVTGEVHGSFNLGELAGLHGLASLLPLFVLWGIAAAMWMRMHRLSGTRESSGPLT